MGNRFKELPPDRTERMGRFCAELLNGSNPWIFRRKESVTVLDEATIKRQQSVDFSLDHIESLGDQYAEVCGEVFGPDLCVAPLFILAKDPASSLSFDLEDETGRTLSLMSTEENAEISAATLKVLCREKLRVGRMTLPERLELILEQIALSPTTDGREWLDRLENPMEADNWRAEAEYLLSGGDDGGQIRWWLQTMAVASIVMVAFEPAKSHRRVIKIAYEQPMESERGWLAKLAIQSFKAVVVAPLIRSDRYLFDVTAPPDFRLTRAGLLDDKAEKPINAPGFRRRAQLYVDGVHDPRGAIATFGLRVSGRGVLGGALVGAGLALIAIVACIYFATEIVEGTGDTGLLLVLPGLVATYVARSDQHGLTTRMLAWPRWILLGCGVMAYYAAGALTLIGRVEDGLGGPAREKAVDHLDSLAFWFLLPAAVLAGIGTLLIFLGWLCTRERTHRVRRWLQRFRRWYRRPRFRIEKKLRVPTERLWAAMGAEVERLRVSARTQEVEIVENPPTEDHPGSFECVLYRRLGGFSWTHGIEMVPVPTGTNINWLYEVTGPRFTRILQLGLALRGRWTANTLIAEFEKANAR
ncbi:MAG TPA: hypothetical protein VFS54_00545 [Solirubrobacterales bacterium]|nr:hypothetical protein [Solirubrobacterales bacterium]